MNRQSTLKLQRITDWDKDEAPFWTASTIRMFHRFPENIALKVWLIMQLVLGPCSADVTHLPTGNAYRVVNFSHWHANKQLLEGTLMFIVQIQSHQAYPSF